MTLCVVSRPRRSILDSGENTGQALNSDTDAAEALQQFDDSLTNLESVLSSYSDTVERIFTPGPQESIGQVPENARFARFANRRENIQGLRNRSVIYFTSTPDISLSDVDPEIARQSFFRRGEFHFPDADHLPQVLPIRPPFQIYQDPGDRDEAEASSRGSDTFGPPA